MEFLQLKAESFAWGRGGVGSWPSHSWNPESYCSTVRFARPARPRTSELLVGPWKVILASSRRWACCHFAASALHIFRSLKLSQLIFSLPLMAPRRAPSIMHQVFDPAACGMEGVWFGGSWEEFRPGQDLSLLLMLQITALP